MDALQQFIHRVTEDWLKVYCNDMKRSYDPQGFDETSIKVAEADARDCMLAIDHGVVYDLQGGRYRACMSSANEVLFWEGRKDKPIRRITLWQEPVITFAALARLHLTHNWPKEKLGMQTKGWAFDLAAYDKGAIHAPRILGEVKKSSAELKRLRIELIGLSDGAPAESVSINSARKWNALLDTKPNTIWLVGPDEESYIYAYTYSKGGCTLQEVNSSALAYSAA
ncbi:hypothetical protein [Pseudaquabacterium pictum]|uniref:Uncharacterized protein n=1 Tax=Pseudaquabacterium pictum TaxID=2315236 RepID=A0A480ARC5_9BURK|nr:hypothetical protein [Rubrivivax pictus]GCL62582.1 hypothetical protein AQPW35_16630 [Rubrivivax pictus]